MNTRTSQPTDASTGRSDAARNRGRVLDAAREVLAERGSDACIEEIAARAGVGIGTVYRHFGGKDALVDELLRVAIEQVSHAADAALRREDGGGLEEFLRAIGRCFAGHAKYAHLLMQRRSDGEAARRTRAAVEELTDAALRAGTIDPAVTSGDVMALIWAMRGLVEASSEFAPQVWERFLDIHLAGLRAPGSLSRARSLSARQVAEVAGAVVGRR
ncbi:MAG: TetR/AcrR family transcriptional regulator [Actinobacteria bacterium]|nr:TetR/AcrR family transcriptional regulator [Actinomycetota bacterium]